MHMQPTEFRNEIGRNKRLGRLKVNAKQIDFWNIPRASSLLNSTQPTRSGQDPSRISKTQSKSYEKAQSMDLLADSTDAIAAIRPPALYSETDQYHSFPFRIQNTWW